MTWKHTHTHPLIWKGSGGGRGRGDETVVAPAALAVVVPQWRCCHPTHAHTHTCSRTRMGFSVVNRRICFALRSTHSMPSTPRKRLLLSTLGRLAKAKAEGTMGCDPTPTSAHDGESAPQQRHTNRFLMVIAFFVGVLCASVVWKHQMRMGRPAWRAAHSAGGGRWPFPTRGHDVPAEEGTLAFAPDTVQQLRGFRCPCTRTFTRAEVAEHHSREDLYIVLDGNVLDVSSFASQHPGGDSLLDGAGGDDVAALFAQFHHPSSVALLASFCIGRLRTS